MDIGTIEHYEQKEVVSLIREMFRVCSLNGIVAIGVPNFYSGPILKAWSLKKIKFIPGYKLDTEKFYSPDSLIKVFQDVGAELDRKISYVKIERFGNPLPMETPGFILKTIGQLISFLFKKNRFLNMVVCKFQNND